MQEGLRGYLSEKNEILVVCRVIVSSHCRQASLQVQPGDEDGNFGKNNAVVLSGFRLDSFEGPVLLLVSFFLWRAHSEH